VTDFTDEPLPESTRGRRRHKPVFVRLLPDEKRKWQDIVSKSGLTEQELGRRRLLGLREPLQVNSRAIHLVSQAAQLLEDLATYVQGISQVLPVKAIADRIGAIRTQLREAIESLS
jgi:hypothetical protein